MPHLTLEHSANLSAKADLSALCHELKEAVLETGLFEVGAVRVRAIACDAYAVADELPDNAFLDMNFRISSADPKVNVHIPRKIGQYGKIGQ